jgi:hypothetical protein
LWLAVVGQAAPIHVAVAAVALVDIITIQSFCSLGL